MPRPGPFGWTVLLATLLALAVAGCGGADPPGKVAREPEVAPPAGPAPPSRIGSPERRLALVAPAALVQPGWTDDFEQRTGCSVSVRTADSPSAVARLVRTGRYDAVAATGDAGLPLIAGGAVAPLNLDLIPGAADLFDGLRGRRIGGRVYEVAQGRAATLLLWRKDKIPGSLRSLDAVFDPVQLQPISGKVAVQDTPLAIAEAALWLRRERKDLEITNPYELDARQFDAAVAALGRQRNAVDLYWTDPADARAAFSTGAVVVGDGRQSLYDGLTEEDGTPRPPVGGVLPREGATGWSDAWMVTTKATHPNCAYRWIAHMLEPRTNARVAETLGIAPSNRKACDLTRDEDWCDRYHAGDESYWDKVALYTAPMADCGDERGKVCEDYSAWVAAWRELRG
jgi:putative spermidine/putrescine transport system substrate-binding protein